MKMGRRELRLLVISRWGARNVSTGKVVTSGKRRAPPSATNRSKRIMGCQPQLVGCATVCSEGHQKSLTISWRPTKTRSNFDITPHNVRRILAIENVEITTAISSGLFHGPRFLTYKISRRLVLFAFGSKAEGEPSVVFLAPLQPSLFRAVYSFKWGKKVISAGAKRLYAPISKGDIQWSL